MQFLFATARHSWTWVQRLFVAVLVLAALVLLALRLLLPWADAYRTELSASVSDYLGVPVELGELELAWWGWGPALKINHVSLRDPDMQASLLRFRQAVARFDLSRSLLTRRAVLATMRLQGEQLVLQWDGAGGFSLLPKSDDPSAAALPLVQLIPWLQQIDTLDLSFDRVILHHAESGRRYQLGHDLRLSLHTAGQRRQIELELPLAESFGQGLHGVIELAGQAQQAASWQVNFYFKGVGLTPADWPLPQTLAAGSANIELWGDWQPSGFGEIMTQVQLRDPLPPADLAGAESLQLLLSATPDWNLSMQGRRQNNDWSWQAELHGIDISGQKQVDSYLRLDSVASQRYEGRLLRLPLQGLVALAGPWLALDTEQREPLAALKPAGRVAELVFDFEPGQGRLEVAGRFEQVRSQASEHWPGLSGLDGTFAFNETGGRLELQALEPQLESALWPDGIELDRLEGVINWARQDHGWYLTIPALTVANADLETTLSGDISLDQTGSRFDLQAAYQDIDIARLSRYWPEPMMQPKLVAWLKPALVSGKVVQGSTRLRGRWYGFDPILLETRLRVAAVTLDYKPGWPSISGLDGEIILRNRSLVFNADKGQLFDAKLHHVKAAIADFKQPVLNLTGQALGTGSSLLRFIEDSPLAQTVGVHLVGMEVTGDTVLTLDLDLPLKGKPKPKPATVRGSVAFQGGDVRLADYALNLQAVQGTLAFDNKMLSAKNIKLNLRGAPVRLNIATVSSGQGAKAFQFQLAGSMGIAALAGPQAARFEPYLQGRSHWTVELTVPEQKSAQLGSRLVLTSDLQGSTVLLPAPLHKAATTVRPLRLETQVHKVKDALQQVNLIYGDDARALLEVRNTETGLHFERGELRINAGQPQTVTTPGLQVVARLAELTLEHFGERSSDSGGGPRFQRLQAQIDQLHIGGQTLRGVAVKGELRGDTLALDLQGPDIQGQVLMPAQPSAAQSVRMDLQKLALNWGENSDSAAASTTVRTTDPRRLPSVRLKAEQFQLNGRVLGQLQFSAVPDESGLRLETLELQSPQHRLSASGAWRQTQTGQESRIEAKLYSQTLASTLATLGFDVDLHRAETALDLGLIWPGAFSDFTLAAVQGYLQLHISKGQLRNVDPGLGRMVGLLNVFAIARRLQLDFTDLFGEGLAFDRVDGRFTFIDGEIYTNDFALFGPSANILLEGSVYLFERSLKQTVTIVPQIGSSLAIASTLAGGPVVGAAVLLAGQVLKPGIDRVVSYQYGVSGHWDDPQVKRLAIPLRESGTSGLENNRK